MDTDGWIDFFAFPCHVGLFAKQAEGCRKLVMIGIGLRDPEGFSGVEIDVDDVPFRLSGQAERHVRGGLT